VAAKPAKAVVAPKAPKPAKAAKAVPAPPPAGGAEGAPVAADYRVNSSSINDSVCLGRRIKGGEDKRWKPAVYRESQCGAAVVEGSDLCTKCQGRSEKYDADPTPKADWTGRINEEPLDWVHMLGTPWALAKKPVFQGGPVFTGSASSAASSAPASEGEEEAPVASSSSSAGASVPPPPATKKAAAAAAKALKDKEKADKKAAAEKAKADKEAAKAAKKAAPKAKKAPKAAGGAGGPPPPAEAAVSEAEEAEDVEGAIKLIDGIMYIIKDGNVYECEETGEEFKTGDYVGRLKEGGESIDTEAEEVKAEEEED